MIADDASNTSMMIGLFVAGFVGVFAGTLAALVRWDRLDAGAEIIELPLACDCDQCNRWYGHRTARAVGKPWWRP